MVDSMRRLSLARVLYAPFLAQVVVTRQCNLTCGYCDEYDSFSPPVPYDDLVARLERLRALGTFAVELTGGEPMLHPRIHDLVAKARGLGFLKVMMISNAYLFNEAKIRSLNGAGLQHLQVSVDGVAPNETTVKVLRPLRKKLEVLARVARFEVTLSGVIGAAPPAEVIEVIEFARAHGFKPRVLLLHDHDGQLQLGAEDLALYRRLARELRATFSEAWDYRSKLAAGEDAPFRCRAGSRYLYIDEHGMVRWCSQQRAAFGKPLLEYTAEDLKTQFYTRKDCNPRCTIGCARSSSKVDELRAQHLTVS